jgi:hypothetical protein
LLYKLLLLKKIKELASELLIVLESYLVLLLLP